MYKRASHIWYRLNVDRLENQKGQKNIFKERQEDLQIQSIDAGKTK